MKRKFSYKIQLVDIAMIAAGGLLMIYDVSRLQTGYHAFLKTNMSFSIILAFMTAFVANVFAFDWGMRNGRNSAKRIFNKNSIISFLCWVAMGVWYGVIMSKSGQADVESCILLAISYIVSGILLQIAARDIQNVDAAACRAAESEYSELNKKLSKDNAEIDYMLTSLDNYGQNYDLLNEKYEQQLGAIRKAEDSVVNEILGKTLQQNPEITPSEARKVVAQARADFFGTEAA